MNQLSEINVRSARSDDFYKIVKIMQKLASSQNKDDQFLTTPEQLIKDGGFESLDDPKLFECAVAEMKFGTQLELIGYATWYYGITSWEGKIAYLADFDIDEQFRTKETARKLLSFISKEIVKNEAVWLRFSVRKCNQNEIELFEEFGAQDVTNQYDYHIWSFDHPSLQLMSTINM